MYKRKKLMVGILSLMMLFTAAAPMTATVNAATKTKAPAKVTVTSFKRTGNAKTNFFCTYECIGQNDYKRKAAER